MEALLVNAGVHKRLKPSAQVALVDEPQQSAALSRQASRVEFNGLMPESLLMCSVIRKDGQPMTACKVFFYAHFCPYQYGLVLADHNFLKDLNTILTVEKPLSCSMVSSSLN